MDTGQWLTRGTVWLALTLYVVAEATAARNKQMSGTAKWLNTLGFVAFLAHVASAFQFFHGWSHAIAYADTARQTREFTGLNWGGGLYLNYLFTLVWLCEVVWFWTKPGGHAQRPMWMTWTVRGFFLFMMFNGAVVFAHGNVRWFGLILCLTLAICWWPVRKQRSTDTSAQSKSI